MFKPTHRIVRKIHKFKKPSPNAINYQIPVGASLEKYHKYLDTLNKNELNKLEKKYYDEMNKQVLDLTPRWLYAVLLVPPVTIYPALVYFIPYPESHFMELIWIFSGTLGLGGSFVCLIRNDAIKSQYIETKNWYRDFINYIEYVKRTKTKK